MWKQTASVRRDDGPLFWREGLRLLSTSRWWMAWLVEALETAGQHVGL